MYREIMNPEPEKDIPEAEIRGRKILLGDREYDLIMCYLCPICDKPVHAYWKVPTHDHRATSNTIERALRDSGFGGYRFFETDSGQGIEYDPVKDPRGRHKHSKTMSTWSGPVRYEFLWNPFIKLNPVFSVNEFLSSIVDPHGSEYGQNFQFIDSQSTAVDGFISKMEDHKDIFKVSKDILKHGKPIFWFNIVKWDEKIAYFSGDANQRLALLADWFGDAVLKKVDMTSPFKPEEGVAKRRY